MSGGPPQPEGFNWGASAAPPLTRRERVWWAWQMIKRGHWSNGWLYLRGSWKR
jgi:hypothetical protein